jgi:hypothetical protein
MGCSKSSSKPKARTHTSNQVLTNLNGVYPGPCNYNLETQQYECPPPTEIVCIKTEKVYESCKLVQTNEEVTNLAGIAVGEIEDVWCVDVELVIDAQHPFVCEKIQGTRRARTSFYFRYRFAYIDQEGQKYFTSAPVFHEATVIMSDRIFEKQLFVQCEVFLECFECFVSGFQLVTCCIGKLILFKLVALVQLLIPAYGFCPEPDDCVQVEAECPDYEPLWPPFPPQDIIPE